MGTIFKASWQQWHILTSHDEGREALKTDTFNSEEGFAERTAWFIGGFYHIFSFIMFCDTQDNQGADTKVVCAKIGRIIGEVSTVLIPCDLWRWMASNRTAHMALTPSSHHMRLQWDKESGRLVLIHSPVFMWFDLKFSCKKTSNIQTHTQILLHSNRNKDWFSIMMLSRAKWLSFCTANCQRPHAPMDCNLCFFSN